MPIPGVANYQIIELGFFVALVLVLALVLLLAWRAMRSVLATWSKRTRVRAFLWLLPVNIVVAFVLVAPISRTGLRWASYCTSCRDKLLVGDFLEPLHQVLSFFERWGSVIHTLPIFWFFLVAIIILFFMAVRRSYVKLVLRGGSVSVTGFIYAVLLIYTLIFSITILAIFLAPPGTEDILDPPSRESFGPIPG